MHTKFETHRASPKAEYPFPAGSGEGQSSSPEDKQLSPSTSGPAAKLPSSDSFERRDRKPSYIRTGSYERYRPSKSSPLASPTLEAVEAAERSSGAESTHSLTRTLTRDGSTHSPVRPRLYQQVSESNPNGRLVLVRSISASDVEAARPRAPTPERASRIFESVLDAEPREESGANVPVRRPGLFARLKQNWKTLIAQTFNRNG